MLRAVVALLVLLVPSVAQAEGRFALLVGNEAYSSEIGRLANPHNDVALLEQALKGLDFEDRRAGRRTGRTNACRQCLRPTCADRWARRCWILLLFGPWRL
jgi:hypothetical protein